MPFSRGSKVKTISTIREKFANRVGTIVSIHKEDNGYTEYGLNFGRKTTLNSRPEAWFLPTELVEFSFSSNSENELQLSTGFSL